MKSSGLLVGALVLVGALPTQSARVADVVVRVATPMTPPRWAVLERQLLADNVPACREFFTKQFDDRGSLQVLVRRGANDGPEEASEEYSKWTEVHALGAIVETLRWSRSTREGLVGARTDAI